MEDRLPFFDRARELARLRIPPDGRGGFFVVYGRRRIGKTRLIKEAVKGAASTVFYTGDERETPLQIRALASALAGAIPKFDAVEYPGWGALLDRLAADHPAKFVLVLDEFPHLAAQDRSLPSLLQKFVDGEGFRGVTLIICGSSQRMMQGLALDAASPLFGRANQVLKIEALPPGCIGKALGLRSASDMVEAWAVFGGVPRYWELARGFRSAREAAVSLVLDPLGPLHDEPRRLLLDDTRDVVQAASILALVGRGAHRLSEIAGRLGKPATSLTRPIARLVDLGLLHRENPFGSPSKTSKKTLYGIRDPLMRFWFRMVEPNLARLDSGAFEKAGREVMGTLPALVSAAWEDLARMCVPKAEIGGRAWDAPSRYWGPGRDGSPLEIDAVARSMDGAAILVGAATWGDRKTAVKKAVELRGKASRFAGCEGKEPVLVMFSRERLSAEGIEVLSPSDVMKVLAD